MVLCKAGVCLGVADPSSAKPLRTVETQLPTHSMLVPAALLRDKMAECVAAVSTSPHLHPLLSLCVPPSLSHPGTLGGTLSCPAFSLLLLFDIWVPLSPV